MSASQSLSRSASTAATLSFVSLTRTVVTVPPTLAGAEPDTLMLAGAPARQPGALVTSAQPVALQVENVVFTTAAQPLT
ncbi:MAG: hypothetical protein IPK07_03380 [Deltaproteobacteria bacterium]|nr:hypothetical protein [Deltaproteobacteria bacterium]